MTAGSYGRQACSSLPRTEPVGQLRHELPGECGANSAEVRSSRMLNEADIREREGACGLGGGRIKGVVGSGWGSHQGGDGDTKRLKEIRKKGRCIWDEELQQALTAASL
ncbi:hypothetical protein WJX82_001727 [Trebouxia sp. C0006]